jgi:hypothetical protein
LSAMMLAPWRAVVTSESTIDIVHGKVIVTATAAVKPRRYVAVFHVAWLLRSCIPCEWSSARWKVVDAQSRKGDSRMWSSDCESIFMLFDGRNWSGGVMT